RALRLSLDPARRAERVALRERVVVSPLDPQRALVVLDLGESVVAGRVAVVFPGRDLDDGGRRPLAVESLCGEREGRGEALRPLSFCCLCGGLAFGLVASGEEDGVVSPGRADEDEGGRERRQEPERAQLSLRASRAQ